MRFRVKVLVEVMVNVHPGSYRDGELNEAKTMAIEASAHNEADPNRTSVLDCVHGEAEVTGQVVQFVRRVD